MGGSKAKKHSRSNSNKPNNNSANSNVSNNKSKKSSSSKANTNNAANNVADNVPGTSVENAQDIELSIAKKEVDQLVVQILELGYKKAGNMNEEWDDYVKIQNILDRIIKLEAPLELATTGRKPQTVEERAAKIDDFVKWAQDNGVYTKYLRIASFPGYQLGLQATCDIAKGDEVLFVPQKVIFSEEILTNELRRSYQFNTMSNLNLAYALIIEKLKHMSFWKPYIDVLPNRYNTVFYYTIEEMENLRGCAMFQPALRQCKMIARQYAYLHKCMLLAPSMGNNIKQFFCYDLYRWAASTVMTRENLLPRYHLNPECDDLECPTMSPAALEKIAVLIPFWDMANHKSGKITSFYSSDSFCLQSRAMEDVKAGEQYFMHYGNRANAEFLVHNGFIDFENPYNTVKIRLGLGKSDPLFNERLALLKELNLQSCDDYPILPAPEYISPKLLAFVRIFNMNAEQLVHWTSDKERVSDLLHIDCALDTHHDSKSWQYLHTRLMLLLRVFRTSLEDDEALLKEIMDEEKGEASVKPRLSEINLMLLKYRVLEKRILTAALEYAKERSKA